MDNKSSVVGVISTAHRPFKTKKENSLVHTTLATCGDNVPLVLPRWLHDSYKGQRVVCKVCPRLTRKHVDGNLTIFTYLSCMSIWPTEREDTAVVEIEGVVLCNTMMQYTKNNEPCVYFDMRYTVLLHREIELSASCRAFGDVACELHPVVSGDRLWVSGIIGNTYGGARLKIIKFERRGDNGLVKGTLE